MKNQNLENKNIVRLLFLFSHNKMLFVSVVGVDKDNKYRNEFLSAIKETPLFEKKTDREDMIELKKIVTKAELKEKIFDLFIFNMYNLDLDDPLMAELPMDLSHMENYMLEFID